MQHLADCLLDNENDDWVAVAVVLLYNTKKIFLRSKSFTDGGETFGLVVLVNDVAQDVTEGLDSERDM